MRAVARFTPQPTVEDALGVADEVRSALAKLSGAQSSFALAEEPLYHALQAWLEDPSNRDRWLTTAELQNELGPIARAQQRGWPYANARALGQRLAHILDNLQELMGVERKSYGSTYQYAFRPRTK